MLNLKAALACLAGSATFFAAAPSLADPPQLSDAERARVEYIKNALKNEASPVPGRRMIGSGTGFFVAPQRVLTNHHVIEGCAILTVRGDDGKTTKAELVADEKGRDLALIDTEVVAPSIATFRPTATARIGEAVATVGYPDQGLPRIEPFLTVGIMAAVDRADDPSRFVIRADVRPGNSGGPVLDEYGQVLGIVNAKIDTVGVYKRTRQMVDKIGFAIATGPVLQFLKQSGIEPTRGEESPITSGTEQDLLAKARRFTTRVVCWQ